MNKLRPLILVVLLLALLGVGGVQAAKKPKPQLYVPMDYSTCGYRASEAALPSVAVAVTVAWHEGDCSATIQHAIDQVALLRPVASGHRGAVVLGEGVYRLDRPLRLTASGVVLRGAGMGKTVLLKQGFDRGAILYVEGSANQAPQSADTLAVGDAPAGATRLAVKGATMKVGTRVSIVRPCTQEWIDHLGMGDFGGGLDYTGWKPTDVTIVWDRTITAVTTDSVTLDAPVTTALSSRFGGAFMLKASHDGELAECGIEDMTLESAVNDWNAKDEDHCWDGISMDYARDCWVSRVAFRHLAGSAVNLQLHTSRITVEDCIASEPVSEVGGWRRQVFLTRGQQTLFQRCLSWQGIHDFAAGYCAAGPNAFVQCEGNESLGFSGSIGSWAAGLLFDIVNIDGHDLRFANLEQFQFGTGWNTANSMFWQCTASTIACYSPDADNRCSAHGCWGTLTGNANWTSSNDHVSPRSLFYHQLEQRLRRLPMDPRLLPLSVNATSSPTVEQAMAMARQSLSEPRLTLQAWIDSIATATAATPRHPAGKPLGTSAASAAASTASSMQSVPGGFPAGGRPSLRTLTGRQYDIPWWSGRVKDNFVSREARPAITRFVPGREGTGWTDRIDSVVAYLADHRFGSLSHHYGLWYDLRRTDHERVRRADGDVWAPFYEQPFARSGQGTAWDGLSRYDLTKPNQWYWSRLREFADKAAKQGILLFHHHYFQHNILEAGAHWVDSPWRPVNNVNHTTFPEPVPFAGDKRVFMAEQFYNEQDPILRPLHRQYIRMCLDEMKDQPNTVHLISAEYTGPLHFTRFWLETIAEWEAETGRHPLVALSCTRDVQDSLLAMPELSRVVDIVDIRYWHLNTQGLWAPEGGRNLAPRQWMRQVKVGKTGFDEVYRAVRQVHDSHPGKDVTFFAQQHPDYGWAILMAGGALPNVPLRASDSSLAAQLLADIAAMAPLDSCQGGVALGCRDKGYLLYTRQPAASLSVTPARYDVYTVDAATGQIALSHRGLLLKGPFATDGGGSGQVYWLRRR